MFAQGCCGRCPVRGARCAVRGARSSGRSGRSWCRRCGCSYGREFRPIRPCPMRAVPAVRGGPRRSRGREFRPIRTRWREISAEIAVFPPSSSATAVSCSHPAPQRQKPPPSTATLGRSRRPSAVRAHRRPSVREGVSADPHPMEGDFRCDCSFPSFGDTDHGILQSSSVPTSEAGALRAGGSFGRSAPDGGRFPLRLQFSLLPRGRVKAAGNGVRSIVLRSKASRLKMSRLKMSRSKASRSKAPGSTAPPPRRSPRCHQTRRSPRCHQPSRSPRPRPRPRRRHRGRPTDNVPPAARLQRCQIRSPPPRSVPERRYRARTHHEPQREHRHGGRGRHHRAHWYRVVDSEQPDDR